MYLVNYLPVPTLDLQQHIIDRIIHRILHLDQDSIGGRGQELVEGGDEDVRHHEHNGDGVGDHHDPGEPIVSSRCTGLEV